ncbi:Protein AF-17, partial [Irineochytrium annulatum]
GTVTPSGDWFCDRCADNVALADLKTICCQAPGAVVRRTNIPGQYIHAICALWNSSIEFSHGDTNITIDMYLNNLGKICCLCNKSKLNSRGLRSKCNNKDCQNWFHVTCAIEANILTPTKNKNAKNSPASLLCPQHAAKDTKEASKPAPKRKRADPDSVGPEISFSENEDINKKAEAPPNETKRLKPAGSALLADYKADFSRKSAPATFASSSSKMSMFGEKSKTYLKGDDR